MTVGGTAKQGAHLTLCSGASEGHWNWGSLAPAVSHVRWTTSSRRMPCLPVAMSGLPTAPGTHSLLVANVVTPAAPCPGKGRAQSDTELPKRTSSPMQDGGPSRVARSVVSPSRMAASARLVGSLLVPGVRPRPPVGVRPLGCRSVGPRPDRVGGRRPRSWNSVSGPCVRRFWWLSEVGSP